MEQPAFAVVMTLGPATAAPRMVARLLRTADRFRLNASHLTPEGLERWLGRLVRVFAAEGRSVPVVVDLQGAKMRLGRCPVVGRLPRRVSLVLSDRPSRDPARLPVPHPSLFAAVRPGELLTLNDARVELRVEDVRPDRIVATVVRQGPVAPSKGLNRPSHPVPWTALSANDQRCVEVAGRHRFVEFACSFVHTGAESRLLRPATAARLVAKLERPEALEHLPAIAGAFDELWFCRGDLGAQAGLMALGPLQARFVDALPALGRPALLAGQVLHHMTREPEPTRSEVVHLWDAWRAGWRGIVLSDETAVGRHPAAVADFLDDFRATVVGAPRSAGSPVATFCSSSTRRSRSSSSRDAIRAATRPK